MISYGYARRPKNSKEASVILLWAPSEAKRLHTKYSCHAAGVFPNTTSLRSFSVFIAVLDVVITDAGVTDLQVVVI